MTDVQTLLLDLQRGRISRRDFVTRSLALGVSLSTVSSVLAACGGSAGNAGSGATSKKFTLSSNADTVEQKVIQKLLDDFQKKAGYQPNINYVPGSDYPSSVRTYLSSNIPPDAMAYYGGYLAKFFFDKGLITDITDIWQQNNWTSAFPQSFQTVSKGKDGKFYFLPQTWYWWATFYRPSVFQKNGVTPPKTFDELYKVCDKLKSKNITPIVIGSKAPWPAAGIFDMLNQRINGPQFHLDLTAGKAHYTDAKVKQVFTIWKDMIKKGYFTKSPSAYTWDQQVPPLIKGEGGMYIMGRFIHDSFPADAQKDLDFFSFPTYTSGVPRSEEVPVDGYFIPARSRNLPAAKEFIKYMGSTSANQLYVSSVGEELAANTGVPTSTYSEFDQKGIEFIKQAQVVTQFYDRDTDTTVSTRGLAFFGQFLDNPDLNLDSGLSDLDKFAQSIYSQQS